MNENQLLRYSRHILLPAIDLEGQEKLLVAKVLIVGVGGLGSAAAIYLTTSGVGNLVLIDDDRVMLSNLQRQIVHTIEDLGKLKVDSAQHNLAKLNPEVKVTAIPRRLTADELLSEVKAVDVVVDASDNFTTRYLVNKICVKANKPLVSGAAIGFQGQLAVFNLYKNSPCYNCLYPDNQAEDLTSCVETGVAAPLVGIIGSMQAMEVLKIILNKYPAEQATSLITLDALTMNSRSLLIKKDHACQVCNNY